ncbi:MAG: hypothetical protein UX57_C0004G0118 [Candidatus Uhrbacteria bacterium GW2011_GWE2_46_68]|uniref:ParB/Sulfiredoxin domain-containing protein n=2 Tax=Candidatus Uhriibacteriota TaxID=1752732 RepID=A0A0G1Q8T4_9BACT|nr:MAG: hypothetical protein UX45_C0001G0022 [Candidatus Uhrbacteria bacterium GW2011_GWF2_46_218]KKU41414.1 MAG: hypothetical protein UX57_C0004G0118 [Candidatus Uhrbacteria bacterium GW2011_GWE2_46_68]
MRVETVYCSGMKKEIKFPTKQEVDVHINQNRTELFSDPDFREYEEVDIIFLEPTQLIALRDYPPLHSPEAFTVYRKKFVAGERVEPIVVIPSRIVIEYLKKNEVRAHTYRQELELFLNTHPRATYFMLGGKHRSAAATILGVRIPCLVISNDADVAKINALMAEGKLTGMPSVGENFKRTLSELDDHYFEHKVFWTMDEKTKAMIDHGDISL